MLPTRVDPFVGFQERRTMPQLPGQTPEQYDVSRMLDQVHDFANGLIGSAGGFPPFGATVGPDGKVGLIVHQSTKAKSAEEFVSRLVESVRRQAASEGLRAACVARMVEAEVQGQRMTALVASFQHRGAPPVEMIVPFTRDGKSVQFAKPAVHTGTISFF